MSNVIPYTTKTFTKFYIYISDDDDEITPRVKYSPINADSDSDFDPE
jgi:hypothetical protein